MLCHTGAGLGRIPAVQPHNTPARFAHSHKVLVIWVLGGQLGSINACLCLHIHAGILGKLSHANNISQRNWNEVMGINVEGAYNCARAAYPFMKKGGYGKLILMSSIAAVRCGKLTRGEGTFIEGGPGPCQGATKGLVTMRSTNTILSLVLCCFARQTGL